MAKGSSKVQGVNGTAERDGELFSLATLTVEARKRAVAHRLRAVRTEQEQLEALREIAANLIGSERLAVYQVDASMSCCTLRWQFGMDSLLPIQLALAQEEHLRRAAEGDLVMANADSGTAFVGEFSAQALVPIQLRNGFAGVLVLFTLLRQKKSLDASDRELFKLFMH
jgi:hypothetical protein